MRQNRRPAPSNVVPGDTEGITWALPEDAIARLGKGKGCNIALSPNSTYFAVGTAIGLWWYDMSSKSPIALWETERGMISTLDFSHNGERIAIANDDGIIKVLDAQSGECLTQMKRMQEHNVYWHIAFSSDSKWIATANQNGVVEVLDVHESDCIALMDRSEREIISSNIIRLAFSPNGKYVAATAHNPGSEGTLTSIWCSETGELMFNFNGDSFVFSQDGHLLAAAIPVESNDDNSAEHGVVWNIVTGERITNTSSHDDWIEIITFSPCGKFLVYTDSDTILYVRDIVENVNNKVCTDFSMHRTLPFYTQEGELFAIVNGEDTMEVWNVEREEKLPIPEIHPKSIDAMWLKEFPQLALTDISLNKMSKLGNNIHLIPTLRKFDHVPQPVRFLPDGKTVASTSNRMGIVLWDVESRKVRDTLLGNIVISSFLVLPCGNIIGDCSFDNNVNVWSSDELDKPIAEFSETEQTELGRGRAFAPTGDKFAIGSREGTIYLYDFRNKEKLKPLIGHRDFIWSVAFSPDGKRIASGSVDRVPRLWDVETSEEIAALPLDKPRILMGIAFSPCGKVIAGGMYGELRIWCADTLTTLFSIPQPETQKPYALAFSDCGRYLASGTWWQKGMEKMAIRLWDVASGENITTLWGHPTDIQSLAFSPDGTLLASGSFDGTIMLWDVTPYL